MLRRIVTASVALALSAGIAAAAPSQAADDSTIVTFSLTSGSLSINAPASASGSATAGSLVVTATVDNTTVTDATGLLGGWDVTATATDLTGYGSDGTTPNGVTIPCGRMVWLTQNLLVPSGSSGVIDGVAVGTGGAFDLTNDGTCDSVPVATAVSLFGGGTYEYDGLVTLSVPANTPAGQYKTVITQTAL